MLNNIKISYRMLLIVLFAIIGTVVICGLGLQNLQENLILDRQDKTKSLVEAAMSSVTELYEKAEKGEIPVEEAKQRAANRISMMKYGKGDYIWINDQKGVLVAHIDPKRVGTSLYDVKDASGLYFMRRFIEVSEEGGGFVRYLWMRSKEDKVPHRKA